MEPKKPAATHGEYRFEPEQAGIKLEPYSPPDRGPLIIHAAPPPSEAAPPSEESEPLGAAPNPPSAD